MDAVTIAINSLNNELLTWVSILLNNYLIYTLTLLIIIFLFEKKDRNKQGKLIVVLIIVFLVGIIIKAITQIERPCEELIAKVECSSGYSFPSLHAITAFALALGFLDDKKYIWILLFALFVSFTRIYLGVHTFIDVAAALVISPVVYSLVDWYWKRKKL